MASSWAKARLQFEKELFSASAGINKYAQQILVNATSSFLDFVQTNKEQLPYDTGNLHDSIATAVSQSGRIVRANYMPREATKPQTAPGRKRIIGEQEAEQAVRRFRPNRTGVYATLFVAVPYAEGADEKSKRAGYYEWLKSTFESDMAISLRVLSNYPKGKAPKPTFRRFD